MNQIWEYIQYLLNSEEIIRTGGLIAITLIVFIENGLFFGFFLPGDYLLFLSGVFVATKILSVSLPLLLICLFAAAVLGSLIGYISGRYFGDHIENRKDSIFFKKKNIESTQKYFEKYGNQTLILARFLPVVRTFAPILAGLVKMSFGPFMVYNVIGGAIWVGVLVSAGYFLGVQYPEIINYVGYIIFFFLFVTTFAVVRGYLKAISKN